MDLFYCNAQQFFCIRTDVIRLVGFCIQHQKNIIHIHGKLLKQFVTIQNLRILFPEVCSAFLNNQTDKKCSNTEYNRTDKEYCTMLNPGIKGSASVAVTAANTAAAMGSGELNVFATPALAALVEKACWQSVAPELDPGCGTVGTKLELAHNAPTPVGMMVRCESELTAVDGRKLTFSAVMYDDAGEVGRATHERFIIQNEKFQKKADAKKAAE